jgi:hypothetical protein
VDHMIMKNLNIQVSNFQLKLSFAYICRHINVFKVYRFNWEKFPMKGKIYMEMPCTVLGLEYVDGHKYPF